MVVTNEEIERAQVGSSQEMYRMLDRLKREIEHHQFLTGEALARMTEVGKEATALARKVLELEFAIREHRTKKWGGYGVKDDMDFDLYRRVDG